MSFGHRRAKKSLPTSRRTCWQGSCCACQSVHHAQDTIAGAGGRIGPSCEPAARSTARCRRHHRGEDGNCGHRTARRPSVTAWLYHYRHASYSSPLSTIFGISHSQLAPTVPTPHHPREPSQPRWTKDSLPRIRSMSQGRRPGATNEHTHVPSIHPRKVTPPASRTRTGLSQQAPYDVCPRLSGETNAGGPCAQ